MSFSNVALIVGAGPGFSGHVAERLRARGMTVALASRRADDALANRLGAEAFAFNAGDPGGTAALFEQVEERCGAAPSLVMYNPSARVRGSVVEIDPLKVQEAINVTAFGGFLVAQEAAKRMLPQGSGKILLTGATASVKGVAKSAAFAMGKFALRGLAQSMARELHPQGIHVLHVVIDGAIAGGDADNSSEARLDPGALADASLALLDQPRSVWAWEVDLRPWVESF